MRRLLCALALIGLFTACERPPDVKSQNDGKSGSGARKGSSGGGKPAATKSGGEEEIVPPPDKPGYAK